MISVVSNDGILFTSSTLSLSLSHSIFLSIPEQFVCSLIRSFVRLLIGWMVGSFVIFYFVARSRFRTVMKKRIFSPNLNSSSQRKNIGLELLYAIVVAVAVAVSFFKLAPESVDYAYHT